MSDVVKLKLPCQIQTDIYISEKNYEKNTLLH